MPKTFAPFGEGYPGAGDPCRRLGESDTTRPFLDHETTLVGCPDPAAAGALEGRTIAVIDGITLVSIPQSGAAVVEEWPDPPDPETGYNATADVFCGFAGAEPTDRCSAGVKRRWGSDGTTLVEIQKPDGRARAIYFQGVTPYGADSAEADGSAGWDFTVEREDDWNEIRYGPERYRIPDALVIGG
ncbi:hypothetical protein EVJ50_03985 [Synechococcus sp. RSCCF101]|nr:hypothetical protein EVJ50_03985 [Synechococcus sp. RSCCF101]